MPPADRVAVSPEVVRESFGLALHRQHASHSASDIMRMRTSDEGLSRLTTEKKSWAWDGDLLNQVHALMIKPLDALVDGTLHVSQHHVRAQYDSPGFNLLSGAAL